MTEAPAVTEGKGTEGTEGGTPERTFTQADLNKIAANEKRSGTTAGRQAAIEDVLSKTGAESIDDVLSAYTEYKGIQEATESEADRANQRAERLEKRAKTAEQRYTTTLREYALREALRDEGINASRIPLALKVADLESVTVDNDGNVGDITAVVEAVKEASPEWFGEGSRPRVDAPQTRGTGVETPGEGGEPGDMGSALLSFLQASRNKNTTTFS